MAKTKKGVPAPATGPIRVGDVVEVMFGNDKDGHVKHQGKVEMSPRK